MRKRTWLLLLVSLLLVHAKMPCLAADAEVLTLQFDLGGGDAAYPIGENRPFEITLINALSTERYWISVQKRSGALLPPLSLGILESSGCADAIEAADTRIGNVDDEVRMSGVLAALAIPDNCESTIREYVEAATQREVTGGPHTLGAGEELVLAVHREGRSWTFKVTTGGEQRWLVHYGFTFLPDKDEEFFTQSQGDGTFRIMPQADEDGEFEPTVLLTYQPDSLDGRTWIPKITAGLGADLEETLVTLGTSWLVGDNLAVFIGAAGHQQIRLTGSLREGEVVTQTLTEDQLHTETFGINVIAGIGLRFDRTPFSKKEKEPERVQSGTEERREEEGETTGDEPVEPEDVQSLSSEENP